MQLKKVVIIGTLALLLIGCVAAAGCTANYLMTSSDEKLVGAWVSSYNDGNGTVGNCIEVFKRDGTGYLLVLSKEVFARYVASKQFTWKNDGNGIYTRTYTDGMTDTLSLDAATDLLTDTGNRDAVKKRMDPLTGIWTGYGKNDTTAKVFITNIIKTDGTGYMMHLYDDGTVIVYNFNWNKNPDKTYTFVRSDNYTSTWTINSAQNTVTTSHGNAYQKQFNDLFYFPPVLGPWVNTEDKRLLVFSGDNTGSVYSGPDKAHITFTWTLPDAKSIMIQYQSGTTTAGKDLAGTETIWLYITSLNTLVNSETGECLVRPLDNQDGLTYY